MASLQLEIQLSKRSFFYFFSLKIPMQCVVINIVLKFLISFKKNKITKKKNEIDKFGQMIFA
jgi:hypothetical protein